MQNNNCCDNSAGNSWGGHNSDIPFTNNGERNFGRKGGSMPPLPDPLTFSHPLPNHHNNPTHFPAFSSPDRQYPAAPPTMGTNANTSPIKEGCYYIQLIPHSFDPPARYHYEGTFRFQLTEGAAISSGDLYTKDFCQGPVFCPTIAGHGSKARIPVFPRKQYAYYLRVIQISPISQALDKVEIKFEPYHFDHMTRSWEYTDSPLTAKLALRTGIDGIRSWCGDVETASGVIMGHLSAVWISPFLRQAEVEIDCVQGCELPLKNTRGEDWSHVFAKAQWDVYFRVSNSDVKCTGNQKWSTAELHKVMLENRDNVNLDKRWRYHMLAVPQFDDYDAYGVMYDHTSKDINAIPREGAAIAANIRFENHQLWGKCRAKRFGETGDPYFRTAVHEIGHAMMLRHPDNSHENYIMQRTVSVAHNAEPPIEFPENIQWAFSPRDVHLLCHLPDIAVRPGGVSFGSPTQRLPVNARYEVILLENLQLTVKALSDVVPIGAPVRIEFQLKNIGDDHITIPGSLSMKSGHVSGKVVDPSGGSQEFATIMQYTRDIKQQVLKKGQTMKHSITLIWGTEGPLFPQPGFYRVVLNFSWFRDGVKVLTSGNAGVLISAPQNASHAQAAHKILSTSDTLLALAIGGDHQGEGSLAIRQAVEDTALKPHYALVEAKRVGQRFHERAPKLQEAAKVLDEDTKMTRAEVKRISKIVYDTLMELKEKEIQQMRVPIARLLRIISAKANETGVTGDVSVVIKELKRYE